MKLTARMGQWAHVDSWRNEHRVFRRKLGVNFLPPVDQIPEEEEEEEEACQ